MQRVHERGVLMLDLAPGNILVTATARLKLIDFETASEIGVDAPTDAGTPGFRAPEKMLAARRHDRRRTTSRSPR